MTSKIVAKTLYRSLLRTTKPFASTENGPVLCSLLYRNGMDDFLIQHSKFEQHFNRHQEHQSHNMGLDDDEKSEVCRKTSNKNRESWKINDVQLSKEEARDLSSTYHELQRKHSRNHRGEIDKFIGENSYPLRGLPLSVHQSQQHVLLYKHLLRQLFYNEHDKIIKHMNFPSQTIQKNADGCTMGLKMKELIQREFRTQFFHYGGSEFQISAKAKREVGFLVLRELQKRLSWAQSVGMQNLFHQQHSQTIAPSEEYQRKDISIHSLSSETNNDEIGFFPNGFEDIHALPCYPPSSYLQPGAFLVAHPMMNGVFAKSIVCILQHTNSSETHYDCEKDIDERAENRKNKEGNGRRDDGADDNHGTSSGIFNNHIGGTYGLIINLPITVGVPNHDSSRKRFRTLREVMRHDSLPEGVKRAFGDCPVQHGGPVNLSIQMLRVTSDEEEEKLRIGGILLPTIRNESSEKCGKVKSTAMYTDRAVYFGGDIIKASQAVIDGDLEKGE